MAEEKRDVDNQLTPEAREAVRAFVWDMVKKWGTLLGIANLAVLVALAWTVIDFATKEANRLATNAAQKAQAEVEEAIKQLQTRLARKRDELLRCVPTPAVP